MNLIDEVVKYDLEDIAVNLKRCADRMNTTEEEKSELYTYSLKIARKLTLMKGLCHDIDAEFDSLSSYIGEEVYFTAMRYPNTIVHWISYVIGMLPNLLGEWLKLEYGTSAEGKPMPKVYKRYTPEMVSESIDKIYTYDMLRKLFKEANDYIRRCKRFSCKAAVLNAHMSFILSLKYGKFVNFRLNEYDEKIARFLYNKYRITVIRILRNAQNTSSQYEQFEQYMSSAIYDLNMMSEED